MILVKQLTFYNIEEIKVAFYFIQSLKRHIDASICFSTTRILEHIIQLLNHVSAHFHAFILNSL